MDINLYCAMTKLTDVVGRVDYATSPERQEHLLAVAGNIDRLFWGKLADDSQAAYRQAGGHKKGDKCCEARELIVSLPGKVLDMTPNQQTALADRLVSQMRSYTGTECCVGLHLSHTNGNVHAHIIFSDRIALKEPLKKFADRNAWIDANGIRRRTKKEICDDQGKLLPGCNIVSKGNVLSIRYFDDKIAEMKEQGWLRDTKVMLCDWINDTLQPDKQRVLYDPASPYLSQQHIGKKAPKAVKEKIRIYNQNVVWINNLIERGTIDSVRAADIKTEISLSPDRHKAMMTIVSELNASARGNSQEDQELYETYIAVATKKMQPRSDTGLQAKKKEQIREAYRQLTIQRQAYRQSKDDDERGSLKQQIRDLSGTIDRLRDDLGIDRQDTAYARKKRVWDAATEARAASINSRSLIQDAKSASRSAFWEQKKEYEEYAQFLSCSVDARSISPAKAAELEWRAFDKLQRSNMVYGSACKRAESEKRDRRLLSTYKTVALLLASDTSVSGENLDKIVSLYHTATHKISRKAASPDVNPGVTKELDQALQSFCRRICAMYPQNAELASNLKAAYEGAQGNLRDSNLKYDITCKTPPAASRSLRERISLLSATEKPKISDSARSDFLKKIQSIRADQEKTVKGWHYDTTALRDKAAFAWTEFRRVQLTPEQRERSKQEWKSMSSKERSETVDFSRIIEGAALIAAKAASDKLKPTRDATLLLERYHMLASVAAITENLDYETVDTIVSAYRECVANLSTKNVSKVRSHYTKYYTQMLKKDKKIRVLLIESLPKGQSIWLPDGR